MNRAWLAQVISCTCTMYVLAITTGFLDWRVFL
jgi:hypothetical protein